MLPRHVWYVRLQHSNSIHGQPDLLVFLLVVFKPFPAPLSEREKPNKTLIRALYQTPFVQLAPKHFWARVLSLDYPGKLVHQGTGHLIEAYGVPEPNDI